MVAQKKIRVTFCIPVMIIGGVETVFVNTLNELLTNKNLEIKIISHEKITEPLYVDWLKSHPEVPVYVYYPLNDFFEGLQKYCKIFPLKQIRKIIYSLYKNIVRIYNSVDSAAIQDKALSGQKSSEKYFCHVSRLADGKDLKTVFDAFEIFAKQHNDIKLFVIGDGPKASEFKKYASDIARYGI